VGSTNDVSNKTLKAIYRITDCPVLLQNIKHCAPLRITKTITLMGRAVTCEAKTARVIAAIMRVANILIMSVGVTKEDWFGLWVDEK
jgi:hypothetical protein